MTILPLTTIPTAINAVIIAACS